MAASGRIKGITIELNGDSTKLVKALSSVDNSIRNTQNNLRDLDRALKLDPGNTELLKDRQQELAIQIDATKQKIETEKQALDQLRNSDGFDENSRQAQNLKTQIDLDTAALKDLEDQSKATSSIFATQMTVMGTKIKAVGDKISGVGQKVANLGQTMTTRLTLPIVAAGTASVKAASDFDENLNKIDVAFNESADAVKEWAKTATTQFGLSENAALEAAALFGDMGTSMGLTDEEAAQMATTLSGLAGDLASFKNIGVDQAMTALKSVFTGETESLKNLGVVMTQTNLEEFAEKTGRVYKEMSQAEKVALRYEYVLETTKNAQGDYARTADGTANSIRTMQASAENLAVVFGQEILPYITPLLQGLTQLITDFAALDQETKKNIVTALAVVAAAGPIVTVIGTLISTIGGVVSAIGALSTAFGAISAAAPAIGTALAAIGAALTGPIGIIIAIVAAVAALAAAIYLNWDKIKEWTAELGRKIQAFGEAVKQGWEHLKADTAEKWNDIKTSVSNKVSEAANTVKEKWNNVKDVTAKVWGAVKDKVNENGGGIKGVLKTYAEGWKNIVQFAWNAADKATGGALSNMLDSVLQKTAGIRDTIKEKIGDAVDFIKELPGKALQWGKDLIGNFVDGIWATIGSVGEAIGAVADKIASFIHFSLPEDGPLTKANTYMPDMIKLLARGITQSLPILDRAAEQMAGVIANDAMPTIQNGEQAASKTVNAPISITVNGAPGQDVNQLADIIQERMNRAVINQRAVFV